MFDDFGFAPPMFGLAITISELGRPPTANQFRRNEWHEKARTIRAWRETAAILWRIELAEWQKKQGTEPSRRCLTGAKASVRPIYKTRRSLPDTAACAPAAKAVIDGATDIGLLLDDSPEHLREITFHAPEVGLIDGLFVALVGNPQPPK